MAKKEQYSDKPAEPCPECGTWRSPGKTHTKGDTRRNPLDPEQAGTCDG